MKDPLDSPEWRTGEEESVVTVLGEETVVSGQYNTGAAVQALCTSRAEPRVAGVNIIIIIKY